MRVECKKVLIIFIHVPLCFHAYDAHENNSEPKLSIDLIIIYVSLFGLYCFPHTVRIYAVSEMYPKSSVLKRLHGGSFRYCIVR